MERRSVSDLIAEFQPLLRKFENDEELVITDVQEEAGCKVGDNYMSVVMRATVSGKHADGKNYTRSLMTKYLPVHREVTAAFGSSNLFDNESHYYRNILPKLGDFGPICIHAETDKIIMEDLKPKGYAPLNRRQLLDYDHASAVIRTLARLHASSLALKLRDEKEFLALIAPLKEIIFTKVSTVLGKSVVFAIDHAVANLESLDPGSTEIEEGIEYLKSRRDEALGVMKKLVMPGQSKYDVLTHGDAWKNNLMFRHDESGKVEDVKLVDFQVARHASPALDFHYFVYSSLEAEVIAERYEDLVRAYHEEFTKLLRARRVPEQTLRDLTLDWFWNELRRCKDYGVFCSCWLVSVIVAEDHETVNMDEVTMEQIQSYDIAGVKTKPKIAERLKSIISDCVRRYIRPSRMANKK